MKNLNELTRKLVIIPRNVDGEEFSKFTMNCFRRGGAQHRIVTGKRILHLDVVKWRGSWDVGDDATTIIRYLLEEIKKYDYNYSHYL